MASQHFLLRWHYHEATLTLNLPHLLDSEILTDITLSADNQSIKAHMIVLATCSPYFLQLFKNVEHYHRPVVILHNTSYEDLKALISFIYRGHCLVTKDRIPSLLSLAKDLQINGLCDMDISEQNLLAWNQENFPTDINNTDNVKSVPINEENVDISSGHKKIPLHKCFICGKFLSNQYNLRVHMETHEQKYYVCKLCPHVSRSRDALRKHVSYRHQEEFTMRKRKKSETLI